MIRQLNSNNASFVSTQLLKVSFNTTTPLQWAMGSLTQSSFDPKGIVLSEDMNYLYMDMYQDGNRHVLSRI